MLSIKKTSFVELTFDYWRKIYGYRRISVINIV
nr:MAG TPA: hypothetical protein [Caudoviricetes sp.]